MNILRNIDKNAERWLLLLFYVMLVITMSIEVLRREILSFSSIWGEEIVRYAFIYLAWIGAAVAVKDRAHIRIDVVIHYLSPRMKTLIYIFGDLLMLAVGFVALYTSFEVVEVSFDRGSVTDGLRISKVWFLMAVPTGFGLMTWRLLQSIVRDIRSLKDGTPVFEGDKLFD